MLDKQKLQIRKPAVAGQFYPGNHKDLHNMLDGLFASVEKDEELVNKHVNALIAPHAGYIFSGKQAAKAYQYLKKDEYDLVCVISPSHREYFSAVTVFPGDAYRTPLGDCHIHQPARDMILTYTGITAGVQGHKGEHALEVQLPFIQYVLGDVPILPLVMGDQSQDMINRAAKCIMELYGTYGDKILFVASSDLSHFHSADIAGDMDGEFINLLAKVKLDTLYEKIYRDELEACGCGPILALMKGLDISETEIRMLGYSHSGEVLNDNNSVVGYTSAVMNKG